jgi:hypothetical protein
MVKSLLLLLIIFQSLGEDMQEEKCYKKLRDLEKSVYYLKPNNVSPSSSAFVEERLSEFFSLLPDTLISCAGVFEYNLQASVSGLQPDLFFITGCETGYSQFIDQVRRIAKFFANGSIGEVSIACERLSVIRTALFEKCSACLGP